MNNTGKTALLEAIFLLVGEANAGLSTQLPGLRGFDKAEGTLEDIARWMWGSLFTHFTMSDRVTISGMLSDSTTARLELSVVPPESVPAHIIGDPRAQGIPGGSQVPAKVLTVTYVDVHGGQRTSKMTIGERGLDVTPPPQAPGQRCFMLPASFRIPHVEDSHMFGTLEVARKSSAIVQVLRIIEPRLQGLTTIASPVGTVLHGDLGEGPLVPLPLMGDGLTRLTSIMLRISTAQHGVVLIDEVENGLHHSILERVWAAIAEAARRFDVQVFATTHSWECIQAAHRASEQSGRYDLQLLRLERTEGGIRAVTYDQETLGISVEMGLEVR